MPERIANRAETVAIKLILDRAVQRGAGGNGLCRHAIDILDIDVKPDRRAANGRGREGAHLWVFVGQHDETIAYCHLGMADLAVRAIEPQAHLRAKYVLIKRERGGSAGDDQVWRD